MLSKMDNLVTNRFGQFENSLRQSQRQLSDSQLAKIEELMTDSYEFKRKGNKDQYKVNIKVMKKMKEAQSFTKDAPEQNEHTISAAKCIGEGIDILTHRQKLVKMADSSGNGWKTVEEYETNELADDSDDEKRIRRADVKAAQKIKADKKNKKGRIHPYQASTVANRSNAPIPVQVSSMT